MIQEKGHLSDSKAIQQAISESYHKELKIPFIISTLKHDMGLKYKNFKLVATHSNSDKSKRLR